MGLPPVPVGEDECGAGGGEDAVGQGVPGSAVGSRPGLLFRNASLTEPRLGPHGDGRFRDVPFEHSNS